MPTSEIAGPRARCVGYDNATQELVVQLENDTPVRINVNELQGLANASPDDIRRVEIAEQGLALHWDELDVHFSVPGIVAGTYGTKAWMSAIGRKGGAATSETKRRTSRENGRKGGRPRKQELDDRSPRAEVISEAEFVDLIAADVGLEKVDVRAVVVGIADRLQASLDVGTSVQITGFGTFTLRKKARAGLPSNRKVVDVALPEITSRREAPSRIRIPKRKR